MSGHRRDRRKKSRKSRRKPSQPRSSILHNPKRTGEHSEIAFLYRSDQRRFAISKPFGDSERYDFILDNRPRPRVKLFRIQVKCTECLRAGAYETRADLYGRQRPRRLHQARHRLHSRPRSPAGYLVHNPRRSLHPATHAPLLPPPQGQKDAPRKIPRSLALTGSPTSESPNHNHPSLHRPRLSRRSLPRRLRARRRNRISRRVGKASVGRPV